MKALIISDFHAYSSRRRKSKKNADTPSYFCTKVGRLDGGGTNVIDEFKTCLADEKIEVDSVVCCGDLVDSVDTEALPVAWDFHNSVATIVQAKRGFITVGNHDADSRGVSDADGPFEHLKQLAPAYPSVDAAETLAYWANGFFVRETPEIRYLVINSCASHGYKDYHKQGIITARMLELLDEALSRTAVKLINICVCHHHPHRQGEFKLGEDDDMMHGQLLLELLSRPQFGQWIVLHGHKHHPKLSYAQGNSFSPVVFSAGSLSARLYPELQVHARNQFHEITIEPAEVKHYGRLVGKFRSWSWYAGRGWREAEKDEGLPASGGFGYREIPSLREKIVKDLKPGRTEWTDVVGQFPELLYVSPGDLEYLWALLGSANVQREGNVQNYPKHLLKY